MADVRSIYDAKGLLEAMPSGRGELFIGYTGPADVQGWLARRHETLPGRPGRPVARSVWARSSESAASLIVDVAECTSAADAIDELMERLDENELAELVRGPDALGRAAFMHPPGVPGGVFFARANLVVSIVSQGEVKEAVDDWIAQVQRNLDLEPEQATDGITLTRGESSDESGVELHYRLRYDIGPSGWLKFVALGATLERAEAEAGTRERTGTERGIVVRVSAPSFTVRAWAIEPGREPQQGRFEA